MSIYHYSVNRLFPTSNVMVSSGIYNNILRKIFAPQYSFSIFNELRPIINDKHNFKWGFSEIFKVKNAYNHLKLL